MRRVAEAFRDSLTYFGTRRSAFRIPWHRASLFLSTTTRQRSSEAAAPTPPPIMKVWRFQSRSAGAPCVTSRVRGPDRPTRAGIVDDARHFAIERQAAFPEAGAPTRAPSSSPNRCRAPLIHPGRAGSSVSEIAPCRRQPTRASQVRACATTGPESKARAAT
jgi:hypothetical protein